jgi:hypothetical protein
MSETIITALNTEREVIYARLTDLEVRINSARQCDNEDIMTLKKEIENILGS